MGVLKKWEKRGKRNFEENVERERRDRKGILWIGV